MIIKTFITSLLFSISFYQNINLINDEFLSKKNDFSVIVLTETQGFVHHEAIKEGVKLITRLGEENNFNVLHANSSELLSDEVLEKK